MPSAVMYDYQEPVYWYGGDPEWDDGYWDNTSHDSGGSTGDWNPDYTPPPECYPNSTKRCLTALRAEDKKNLDTSFYRFFQPPPWNVDTAKRDRCNEMRTMFNEALALGKVYRGAYNSTIPGTNPQVYDHQELAAQGKMHFDPWFLEAADTSDFWRAQLVNAALHGALHLHNRTHTEGPPDEFWLPGDSAKYGAQYNKAWFSDLNHSRNEFQWASCVYYPDL